MLSHVIPWTSARQNPLSMDFSRQEYWSGLPFPSPEHSFKKQGNPSCYRCALRSSPQIHTNPNYLMGKRTLNINKIQAHHETFLRHCVSTVLPPPVHELTTHTKLTRKLQFPTEALYPICSNLSSGSVYPTHPLHLSQMRSNSGSLLTKASCLSSAEASFPT